MWEVDWGKFMQFPMSVASQGSRAHPKDTTVSPLLSGRQLRSRKGLPGQRCRSTFGTQWNIGSSYFLLFLFWMLTNSCPLRGFFFLNLFLVPLN